MTVFIIQLDRIPASSLGCYGSWQHATPALDALAARSLVFERLFDFSEEFAEILPSCNEVLFTFLPDELLDEITAEDWEQASHAWLGDAGHEMSEDVPDLLDAFFLQPDLMSDIDLMLRLALHATSLRALDRLVGELLDDIHQQAQADDVILVVGRRGEPLIEREAGLEEQPFVRPEIHHLPLLIEWIGHPRPGRISSPLVIDDVQRLREALRSGVSGLGDWTHAVRSRPRISEASPARSIIQTHEWLCVLPRDEDHPPALYHLPEDQWALLNVAPQYPHVVEELCHQVSD